MQASRRSLPGFSPLREGNEMVNVSKEGQVFKCEICGNVVVVKEAGGGELICCGEPMILEE
jgi:desulfoferrodoxin-like iron-binding protein